MVGRREAIMKLTISGDIFEWRGPAPFLFVAVPDDASRDIADSLLRALASEHGSPVPPSRTGPGPRLQDVLIADAPLEVAVHSGFDFWIEGSGAEPTPDVQASLERAMPPAILRVDPDASCLKKRVKKSHQLQRQSSKRSWPARSR
jgi:hypothetical protein